MRIVLLLALCVATAALAANNPAPPPGNLPAGVGGQLIQTRCIRCHSLSVSTGKRQTAAQWGVTVDRMIDRGARISDEEYDVLVDYLAKNFSPAKATATTLPVIAAVKPAKGAGPATRRH